MSSSLSKTIFYGFVFPGNVYDYKITLKPDLPWLGDDDSIEDWEYRITEDHPTLKDKLDSVFAGTDGYSINYIAVADSVHEDDYGANAMPLPDTSMFTLAEYQQWRDMLQEVIDCLEFHKYSEKKQAYVKVKTPKAKMGWFTTVRYL